jgi:hypothetical protein
MSAGFPGGRLAAADFRGACGALAAAWRDAGCAGEWRWRDAPPPRWQPAGAAAPQAGWLELAQHLIRAAPAAGAQDAQDAQDAHARAHAHAHTSNDDEDDPAALPCDAADTWHVYTLHIVHNASYGARAFWRQARIILRCGLCRALTAYRRVSPPRAGVPQLLLRGATRGGAPLAWRDALSDLAPCSAVAAAAARSLAAAAARAAEAEPQALGPEWTTLTPWEHPHTGEARLLRMLLHTAQQRVPALHIAQALTRYPLAHHAAVAGAASVRYRRRPGADARRW